MSSTLLIRVPSTSSSQLVRSNIRQTVLENLDSADAYPTLSDTTIRAMAMMNEENPSMQEVAGIIRRDAVVAAAVLRIANSCMYRGRNTVGDIQKAVLRIGMKECGKIVCSIGLKAISSSCTPEVRNRCDVLHKHSLFVATLASHINRIGRLGFSGIEFSAGLLHDIGRVVACVKAPIESAAVDRLDFQEDEETLIVERNYLGIDHCAIGHQFAVKNNLPEPLAQSILNHHRPQNELSHFELVYLLALADRIANHVQREHNITGYSPSECPLFKELSFSWALERRTSFCRVLPSIVVKAFKETRAMLKTAH
ncbi:MAG TPA: HDOD domain-containing protein [Gemmata sp.]|nr:HDOD domain-containing protein [Gemmata sp.]